MSTKPGRAFFISLMSNDQIQQLHSTERRLAPRYLLPCEISELFCLKVGPKEEKEWKYVEELERGHGKQIWKRRQLEKLGQAESLDEVEELHDFDEYVLMNWNYSKEPTLTDY